MDISNNFDRKWKHFEWFWLNFWTGLITINIHIIVGVSDKWSIVFIIDFSRWTLALICNCLNRIREHVFNIYLQCTAGCLILEYYYIIKIFSVASLLKKAIVDFCNRNLGSNAVFIDIRLKDGSMKRTPWKCSTSISYKNNVHSTRSCKSYAKYSIVIVYVYL